MKLSDIFNLNSIAKKRGVDAFSSMPRFSNEFDFGTPVSNDRALKLTALYAAIRLISENVASLPKQVKQRTPNGLVNNTLHPAFKVINNRPNSYTNVFDFWNCIVTWLNGWGNSYAIIKRDNWGEVMELHQVHPTCVHITFVNGKKYYKVAMHNPDLIYLNGTYESNNILHFMLVTYDGIKGINPIEHNAMALGKSLAIEKFAADYYRKGGNVKSVLETDQSLGDDQYNAFMAHYNQASQNFDTPLLEYGIKFKQVAISPVAAQLIQQETFSIQDIARIMNVPPHMIADLSRSTFSNIEHQNIQFVQYTLRPLVKRLEIELERKLFSAEESLDIDVKFSLDGLLRGDTTSRSSFYHNAILDGYMSRNEVRELEGLERKPELDKMLYPLNTGIVGETDKLTEDGNNNKKTVRKSRSKKEE